MKIFETQDLSGTHGKPKLLFYDYSCQIFFIQAIAEGNCDQFSTQQLIFHSVFKLGSIVFMDWLKDCVTLSAFVFAAK